MVPRSGVSAPHSGGAEPGTGKRVLPPGLARFGKTRALGQEVGVAAEGEGAAPSLSLAPR